MCNIEKKNKKSNIHHSNRKEFTLDGIIPN